VIFADTSKERAKTESDKIVKLQTQLQEKDERIQQLEQQLGISGIPMLSADEMSFIPLPPPIAPPSSIAPPPMAPPPPSLSIDPKPLVITKKAGVPMPDKGPDPREQLLAAIRAPKALKHVEEGEVNAKPIAVDDSNVLNLIAKALIDRRAAIKEDINEEEANDNLEDWL